MPTRQSSTQVYNDLKHFRDEYRKLSRKCESIIDSIYKEISENYNPIIKEIEKIDDTEIILNYCARKFKIKAIVPLKNSTKAFGNVKCSIIKRNNKVKKVSSYFFDKLGNIYITDSQGYDCNDVATQFLDDIYNYFTMNQE